MLKKAYRLNSLALKNPNKISAKYFSLKYSQNKEKLNRFTFVVSKKTDSRASARNEMKRKLRAGVEELFKYIIPGHDFVFYPKKETLNVTSKIALEELKQVLKKENLLNV